MAIARGAYAKGYGFTGAILWAITTLLLSEDSDFVFLSEDGMDLLMAEQPHDSSVGIFRTGYAEEGTYERKEL